MRALQVTVIPNAKMEKVEAFGSDKYTVHVTPAPLKGKANKAMVKALAKYLNVRQSDLLVTKGEATREKTVLLSE